VQLVQVLSSLNITPALCLHQTLLVLQMQLQQVGEMQAVVQLKHYAIIALGISDVWC
jgi:hypothetical protein